MIDTSTPLTPDLEAARTRLWRREIDDIVRADPRAFVMLVKRRREALGCSQRGLARLCGIASTVICDMEAGRSFPIPSNVEWIVTMLDITKDDLQDAANAAYLANMAA